jgi:hypothetical protein
VAPGRTSTADAISNPRTDVSMVYCAPYCPETCPESTFWELGDEIAGGWSAARKPKPAHCWRNIAITLITQREATLERFRVVVGVIA